MAVGAEFIYETAEDEGWVKAESYVLKFSLAIGFHTKTRFKIHLRVGDEIPLLPLNKTVVEVFADFLSYLLECTSTYIQESHANGVNLWASVKDEIDFVLSHPDEWESTELREMRKAAILAKLVPDTTAGHARLSFVIESEASLHFAVRNGLPTSPMKDGNGVVIVNAGRATIDISSYSKNTGHAFGQVAAPQCKTFLHFFFFFKKKLPISYRALPWLGIR